MQRGRLLILLGLLVLLGAGLLFVVLLLRQQSTTQTSTGEATPTVPPIDITKIVIAIQPLPRGSKIPPEAVTLAPWPTNSLPETRITNLEDVVGKLARYDIERGEPILTTLVVEDTRSGLDTRPLSAIGSDAALRIPSGQVALTIPMTRLTGVGYALEEGDHVNVLASLLFVDVDEEKQTTFPNTYTLIVRNQDPVTQLVTITSSGLGNEGTFLEDNPLTPEGQILVQPAELPRPRLVVQQIVQDAVVLNVGDFAKEGVVIAQASPTPLPEGSPPPPPTAVPPPDIITLIVSPQDSLVLNYFLYANARLTLALRAAGDTSRVDTESVTLQYAVERFRISVPTPLNFALEPAVRNVHQPILQNEPPPTIIPLPDGKYICAGPNCP
jgi:pilus assembly protein CpaB